MGSTANAVDPSPRSTKEMGYFKDRHKEHESGWIVLFEEKEIVELSYLHDDQPFHLFRPKIIEENQEVLSHCIASNTSRDPDPKVTYKNREKEITVGDDMFFVSHDEEMNIVSIRDMRVPKKEELSAPEKASGWFNKLFGPKY